MCIFFEAGRAGSKFYEKTFFYGGEYAVRTEKTKKNPRTKAFKGGKGKCGAISPDTYTG